MSARVGPDGHWRTRLLVFKYGESGSEHCEAAAELTVSSWTAPDGEYDYPRAQAVESDVVRTFICLIGWLFHGAQQSASTANYNKG